MTKLERSFYKALLVLSKVMPVIKAARLLFASGCYDRLTDKQLTNCIKRVKASRK